MENSSKEVKKAGALYLIPTFLGDANPAIIPDHIKLAVQNIDEFIAENARSARRFLRAIGFTKNFDTEVVIHELNKHGKNDFQLMLKNIRYGKNVGVISEAGSPCIADPGNEAVTMAHKLGYTVIPLVGPSAILLALIASGFNGQQFTFHGYLPIETSARKKAINDMQNMLFKTKASQIFMETPFRNNPLLAELLQTLRPETKLCIACDLTLETEFIQTKKCSEWKVSIPELHKRFCVFLIGE